MIGGIQEKIMLGPASSPSSGETDMTLSYGGRTITVPVRVDGSGRLSPETHRLSSNIVPILKACAAGLRITMIMAADESWGIGRSGGLPWRCPEDLRHFRRRTMGGRLLMGRTTFAGLPARLDGRTIHVLSSASGDGFATVDGALAALAGTSHEEIIVAGGGRLYAAALPYCTHAEVTRMKGSHGCDTFAPDLAAAGWKIERRANLSDNIEIEYWESRT